MAAGKGEEGETRRKKERKKERACKKRILQGRTRIWKEGRKTRRKEGNPWKEDFFLVCRQWLWWARSERVLTADEEPRMEGSNNNTERTMAIMLPARIMVFSFDFSMPAMQAKRKEGRKDITEGMKEGHQGMKDITGRGGKAISHTTARRGMEGKKNGLWMWM